MIEVSFRFYAQLNDFLPIGLQGQRFQHPINVTSSIKDAVEAIGVPHPEIDLLLVKGASVPFWHRLHGGDSVSVYPAFRSFDLAGIHRVGADPPEPIRFVADGHLGKLASFLRLAGFDTLVLDDDAAISTAAARDGRVVLTRDLNLLKRNAIRFGRYVRNILPEPQLAELFEHFSLAEHVKPFTRCLRCNELVRSMAKAELGNRVPLRSRACFEDFTVCPACNRVYWGGSHYERLRCLLERAIRLGSASRVG
jgi:uncharacterized protein with PIN domain